MSFDMNDFKIVIECVGGPLDGPLETWASMNSTFSPDFSLGKYIPGSDGKSYWVPRAREATR
jgi:hypothetical protein